MSSVQRHQEFLVPSGQALDGHHLAANGNRPGLDAEFHAFEAVGHLHFPGLLEQHLGGAHRLCGADQEASRLDDAGLLESDVFRGVAKEVRVVQ
ncbi:hypothetical protein D9M72_603590 [compost metagenome]